MRARKGSNQTEMQKTVSKIAKEHRVTVTSLTDALCHWALENGVDIAGLDNLEKTAQRGRKADPQKKFEKLLAMGVPAEVARMTAFGE